MITGPAEPTDCAPLPAATASERSAVRQCCPPPDPPDPPEGACAPEGPPPEVEPLGAVVAEVPAEALSSPDGAGVVSVPLPGSAVADVLAEGESSAEALSLLDPPPHAVRTRPALRVATVSGRVRRRRMDDLTEGRTALDVRGPRAPSPTTLPHAEPFPARCRKARTSLSSSCDTATSTAFLGPV